MALVVRHRPARPAPASAGRAAVLVPPPRCLHHQRGARPRMSSGLGRDDIRALLDDLSAELAMRGARAELFLVGGAALAVAYDAARSTRDLDAVFIPSDVVRQAPAKVRFLLTEIVDSMPH